MPQRWNSSSGFSPDIAVRQEGHKQARLTLPRNFALRKGEKREKRPEVAGREDPGGRRKSGSRGIEGHGAGETRHGNGVNHCLAESQGFPAPRKEASTGCESIGTTGTRTELTIRCDARCSGGCNRTSGVDRFSGPRKMRAGERRCV
jgi:hypothetical protein